jgi:hypothetical protein
MPTLKTTPNPKGRIELGDIVLAAAKTADTKQVKARLAAFAQAHKAFAAAQANVIKAEEARRKALAEVADRDVQQDEAVMALAAALAGDGLPRVNPFKPLGFEAPSTIVNLGYEREARVVTSLSQMVNRRRDLGKASHFASITLGRAAAAVLAAIEAARPFEGARRAALAQRDALEQPWETALASLKRGARAAADEGAPALYSVLFEGRKPLKKKARKKAAPKPA